MKTGRCLAGVHFTPVTARETEALHPVTDRMERLERNFPYKKAVQGDKPR